MAFKRSFKKFNEEVFLDDLRNVPFSIASMFHEPDNVYWCWETKCWTTMPPLESTVDAHVNQYFITTEIRNAMREHDRIKRKFYKSRNYSVWENYRNMRNKVVSMKRKAAIQHFRKICEDKCDDQRSLWQTMKPYINSHKNINTGRIVLNENDTLIRDKQQVAETLKQWSCLLMFYVIH